MSAKPDPRDRCEVCRFPLPDSADRPDRRRRRCADHLAQAVLFPLTAVPGRRARKEPRR
ncbi:hypothetical protein GCM10009836_59580 [Pseudonocardia ailaonensis]|uniref:Uncharacterized protein n=1 Tax=Pseudonocardia ailaonensis TaxID=367279 RepID=A0ABN2NIN3_9PSEU